MLRRTPPLPPRGRRRSQRGDILLVSMVFLLLCLLLLVSSMRDTISDTHQASSTLMRQKVAQVADVAMQNVRNQILTLAPAGLPLETSTAVTNQNWWRPTSPATPPTDADWQICSVAPSVNTPATRCGVINLSVAGTTLTGYTAYAVVEPTGRSDRNSTQCNVGNGLAQGVFYAIFVHVQETNGATFVNTESVYQACEQT